MNKALMKYRGGRHEIKYGRRRIEFELTYSDRQDLTINVLPDMRVMVKAPVGKPAGEVTRRVQRRVEWIARQLDYFSKFQPLPSQRLNVSGETVVYLGRQYRLKVIKADQESVKLVGKYLQVRTSLGGNREYVGKMVDGWYDDHARRVLPQRLAGCLETAVRAGIDPPAVRFRRMKARWGSCAKSGVITLNVELVKAPVHCIDYVIMHELCHQKHRDHSPAFWKLLSRLMPDWERRKRRLEEVVV